MQQFFNQTSDSHRTIPSDPGWDYVHAGLTRNLTAVLNYYHHRPFAVKSQHILARLLNSLGVPYTAGLERFYDLVDAKALSLGMTMKMTSSINKGILHDGLFYGPGCKEIIIATNDSFSPYHVTRNWRTAAAVKVLAHPRSDLTMLLPTGRETSSEKGLVTIAVNIPMLAVQYRAFMNHQISRQGVEGHQPLTTAQFIHMYVLSNMMPSHLDCCLFNRAYNLCTGAPMGESLARHRITLIDYSARVDKIYSSLTRAVDKNDKDYYSILDGFPLVSSPSFRELNYLPDQAPTRQLAWAECLTRLKTVDWLTLVSPNQGETLNRSDNNYFIKEFLQHRNDNTFGHILDNETFFESARMIRDIANRCRPDMSRTQRSILA